MDVFHKFNTWRPPGPIWPFQMAIKKGGPGWWRHRIIHEIIHPLYICYASMKNIQFIHPVYTSMIFIYIHLFSQVFPHVFPNFPMFFPCLFPVPCRSIETRWWPAKPREPSPCSAQTTERWCVARLDVDMLWLDIEYHSTCMIQVYHST